MKGDLCTTRVLWDVASGSVLLLARHRAESTRQSDLTSDDAHAVHVQRKSGHFPQHVEEAKLHHVEVQVLETVHCDAEEGACASTAPAQRHGARARS